MINKNFFIHQGVLSGSLPEVYDFIARGQEVYLSDPFGFLAPDGSPGALLTLSLAEMLDLDDDAGLDTSLNASAHKGKSLALATGHYSSSVCLDENNTQLVSISLTALDSKAGAIDHAKLPQSIFLDKVEYPFPYVLDAAHEAVQAKPAFTISFRLCAGISSGLVKQQPGSAIGLLYAGVMQRISDSEDGRHVKFALPCVDSWEAVETLLNPDKSQSNPHNYDDVRDRDTHCAQVVLHGNNERVELKLSSVLEEMQGKTALMQGNGSMNLINSVVSCVLPGGNTLLSFHATVEFEPMHYDKVYKENVFSTKTTAGGSMGVESKGTVGLGGFNDMEEAGDLAEQINSFLAPDATTAGVSATAAAASTGSAAVKYPTPLPADYHDNSDLQRLAGIDQYSHFAIQTGALNPKLSAEENATLRMQQRSWRLSIEVRSIKIAQAASKIFVKYHLPVADQKKPFKTNPPTVARKGSTTHLPHSFAAYHFPRRSFAEWESTFGSPVEGAGQYNFNKELRLEVWERELRGNNADRMLGICELEMKDLLYAKVLNAKDKKGGMRSFSPYLGSDGLASSSLKANQGEYDADPLGTGLQNVAGFRMLDETLAITSKDSRNKTITYGDLRVLVFLEDLGPAPTLPPGAIGSDALMSALNYANESKAAYEAIPAAKPATTAPLTMSNKSSPAKPAAVSVKSQPSTSAASAQLEATIARNLSGDAGPAAAAIKALEQRQQQIMATPAFSTAYEIELWKRGEEDKFKKQMQGEEKRLRMELEFEYA